MGIPTSGSQGLWDGELTVRLLPLSLLVQLDESPHLDPSVLMTNNRKTCAINYHVVCNKRSSSNKRPLPHKGWWADSPAWRLFPLSLLVQFVRSLHLDPSALVTNNRKTCTINYLVVCNKRSHFSGFFLCLSECNLSESLHLDSSTKCPGDKITEKLVQSITMLSLINAPTPINAPPPP